MTANTVNGSGNGARSGAQTLLLLAAPLNVFVLRALASGPKRQTDLRRAAGSPAQTTLRAQLKRLEAIDAIQKHRRNTFPGVLEYELTPPGRELVAVLAVLDHWLFHAPNAALALGSGAAKAAIKTLAEAWSTTMLRALAAKPLSLTELDSLIGSLSYPALERRLGAMRLAGQIEAKRGNGRGTPYTVTEWLRRGVGPITTAARWERAHLPGETAPLGKLDVEAAFLLAVPLLRLPHEPSGTCRIAAEIASGNERRLAGVIVGAENGHIASCTTRLQGSPDAWALGSPVAWLAAMVEGDHTGLELGGDSGFARELLDALHESLFKIRARLN